jgi:hypothetical protein
MYIGESCMVRYADGDRFIWWNAKIKSIQKHTVSVIWMEGEYRGTETPGIRYAELFLDDAKNDISTIKNDIAEIKGDILFNRNKVIDLITPLLKGFLEKLDDLNTKLEKQTKIDFFDNDLVSYDSSLNRLADSLRGLSSGSVEMDDIPTFSNRKKYTSYDGDRKY